MDILPLNEDYADYLHDESRSQGSAELICFPESETDVCAALQHLYASGTPVTVQGARTGLAAGAVPSAGAVINMSRMNRALGMRRDESGRFYLRVQPGLSLMELRTALRTRSLPTDGWDAASRAAWQEFLGAPEQTFACDPTETSASLGGIAACNASGSRSYHYGAARHHISALRIALSDGSMLALRRGEVFAQGRSLQVTCENGRVIHAQLPSYTMPDAKNASGYFVHDDMDAIDAILGSDGTLGVICELELALTPAPGATWGVSCFFPAEEAALDFVMAARESVSCAAAIEYFDPSALDLLREEAAAQGAACEFPAPPQDAACCVFVELDCENEDQAEEQLGELACALEEAGGDADATWVATTEAEREEQRLFRHAAPACANRTIDRTRQQFPSVTKLGSDMSVPPARLKDVVALYRSSLAAEGLRSATWGHIGNAHLHVNVLPRNDDEYARGKAMFARWAAEVSAMGGAVSAEHGVGKLKRNFLATMYGDEAIADMARFKLAFDPKAQLGRGNLFAAELLDSLKQDA